MTYSEIIERRDEIGTASITGEGMELQERRFQDEDSYAAIGYAIIADGAEVGMMTVIVSEETPAYIERIDIDEDKRGHGIGTKAIRLAADSFDGVALAPDSEDSERLYKRIGRAYDLPEIDQGYGVYIVD